jgi:hypothetical protein
MRACRTPRVQLPCALEWTRPAADMVPARSRIRVCIIGTCGTLPVVVRFRPDRCDSVGCAVRLGCLSMCLLPNRVEGFV